MKGRNLRFHRDLVTGPEISGRNLPGGVKFLGIRPCDRCDDANDYRGADGTAIATRILCVEEESRGPIY